MMKFSIPFLALLACAACTQNGGVSTGSTKIPKAIYYPEIPPLPVGEPVQISPTIEGGIPTTWDVSPALPKGLLIDDKGNITGTPDKTTAPDGFTIRASNSFGKVQVKIALAVLPNDVEGLETDFWVELVQDQLEYPVKMRFDASGRLIFGELRTGRIRVIDVFGRLRPEPIATLPVGLGAQAGLLGIALPPDHAQTREVYAYAIGPDKVGRIWKVIEAQAPGKETPVPTLVVNSLPSGDINNGGDLEFGPDGKLWLSIGDCGDAKRAQKDRDLAGRILRFERDGSIPQDNPIPGSPEWCRGLRNSFDMDFHPRTGGLFAVDNGVDTKDELNFVRRGDNFEWPSIPTNSSRRTVGARLSQWTPVIAPTAIVWHPGRGWEVPDGNTLYIASYLDRTIRRLRMSGPLVTDIDEEKVFLRFRDVNGRGNIPLGMSIGPQGNIYIATASAIWRVKRQGGNTASRPTLR